MTWSYEHTCGMTFVSAFCSGVFDSSSDAVDVLNSRYYPLRHHRPGRPSGRSIPMRCTIKHMTSDERTIANAALGAGPWENPDQIVIAVAHLLGLEPQRVEAVLQRLRTRMVLVCVSAANATSETPSVRYQRSMDWMDD